MEMTRRERILAAINHKEPDRIPLDLGVCDACWLTKPFYLKLLDYLGWKEDNIELTNEVSQTVKLSERMRSFLNVDPVYILFKTTHTPPPWQKKWSDNSGDYMVDEWKITWRRPAGGLYFDVYDFPLRDTDEEDDEAYVWPQSKVRFAEESIAEAKAAHDAGEFVISGPAYGNGFLQHAPRLYGYEDWFAMLIAEPERATKYLDKLLEKKIEWYESLFAQTGGCIDMIAEYDDLGTQRGPWISKELFHKFILPRHKELWAEVKRMSPDVKIFLHTCGSVSSLLGDLIDAGLDCLNPIQINADNMDPYYLKREFGKHLTFWGGGVDTQIILPTGTPQQVADNVKRNIDALAPGGGYVFASVHNVQDDVPPENFMAMLEAFRENCNY